MGDHIHDDVIEPSHVSADLYNSSKTEAPHDLVNRQELTPEEAVQAIRNAVHDSGFSQDELERQAREHNFETLKARLSWMIISTLIGDNADSGNVNTLDEKEHDEGEERDAQKQHD